MRVRMSWNWVGDWPIFVYTTWLDNGVFNVKVVRGVKGNQNAGGCGPSAPAWFEYVQTNLLSKKEVVDEAFKLSKDKLKAEGLW